MRVVVGSMVMARVMARDTAVTVTSPGVRYLHIIYFAMFQYFNIFMIYYNVCYSFSLGKKLVRK